MSPTTIFILVLVVAAVIAVVGIVMVARGRTDADGVTDAVELNRAAKKADKSRRKSRAASAAL